MALPALEWLDLEWSELITDRALEHIARMKSLRYVDIGFCRGTTEAGVRQLKKKRPKLEIEGE